MPQFSKTSQDKLAMAHPDLQMIFNEVVKHYDCTIADTYRSKAAQHEFLLKGLSQIDYPTVHNTRPSWAVDCVPFLNGNISYDDRQCMHFAGYVQAVADRLFEEGKITHKLRSGSTWGLPNHDVNHFSFKDPCHVELYPNPGDQLNYFET